MTRQVRFNFRNDGKMLGCGLITNVGVATFVFRVGSYYILQHRTRRASYMTQNATKRVLKHPYFQNFLGEHAPRKSCLRGGLPTAAV